MTFADGATGEAERDRSAARPRHRGRPMHRPVRR